MYPRWSSDIHYAHLKQPFIDWKQHMLKLHKQRSYFSSGFTLHPILAASKSYRIQEPFISDIDRITNTGVIAVSKYCKFTRHKILFYHYPSYRLIRKFEFKFQIDDTFEWSCQIIGMQTVKVDHKDVRLFALSINQPAPFLDNDNDDEEEEQENELRTLWKVILVYRLHDDGSTTCLANLETTSLFLGRGTWFFTDIGSKTKDWLQIISPDTVHDYSPTTVFMLAYGISMNTFAGHSQIIQFDIQEENNLLDPAKTVFRWDEDQDRFVAMAEQQGHHGNAKVISTFYLGARVSCMIHLAHPLSHLICTGNFLRNELAIYDWRFGVKVGVFLYSQQTDVQPWGFEAGWAITPPINADDYSIYGPRLIVVGDSQDKFQIKIWDISQLLKVQWDPFDDTPRIEHSPARTHHPWWERKTGTLTKIALDPESDLPYTISHETAVKYVHLLDAQIKFTAYINLNTWLYLLHEDGHLSVMDIESGEILHTVYTGGVAEDVNIVGQQVVITRKERLQCSNF